MTAAVREHRIIGGSSAERAGMTAQEWTGVQRKARADANEQLAGIWAPQAGTRVIHTCNGEGVVLKLWRVGGVRVAWDDGQVTAVLARSLIPVDEVRVATRNVLPRANAGAGNRGTHLSFSDRLLTPSQLLNMPQPDWLIDGVLPMASLVMSYGKPGTFKSFVKLDQALHIATGKKWNGVPTQTGLVCYIAAEDIGGYIYRQQAWTELNGAVSDEYMRYYPDGLNLSDPSAVNSVVTWAVNAQPLYVVFDTLRRCLPGVDENSTQAVGKAIDAADRIRRLSGATVDLVHHSEKSGTTYRGTSALGGDMDTILKFTATGMNVTMAQEKQKNSAKEDIRLKMQIVTLGEDEKGRPISSLVARTVTGTDYAEIVEDELGKKDSVLDAIRTNPGVSSAAAIENADVAKSYGYRILNELEACGAVVSENGPNKVRFWFPLD